MFALGRKEREQKIAADKMELQYKQNNLKPFCCTRKGETYRTKKKKKEEETGGKPQHI